MNKKKLALWTVGTMALAALLACGSNSSDSGEQETIKVSDTSIVYDTIVDPVTGETEIIADTVITEVDAVIDTVLQVDPVTGDTSVVVDTVLVSSSSASQSSSSSTAASTLDTTTYDDSHEDSTDYVVNETGATVITLKPSSIEVNGANAANVTVNGTLATITAGGTYVVSGTVSDGQLAVQSTDKEVVQLVLKGAHIVNADGAALVVYQADKTVLILEEGTSNSLTDGKSYSLTGEDDPSAALYSQDNLTISGSGSLTVKGQYADAIATKDGLLIDNGTLVIDAADDGIRGKDYVIVEGGSLTVTADGDGIKSTNDSNSTKGYVQITGGEVNVTSGADGIQAVTKIDVSGGKTEVIAGQDGLNAANYVEISGGTLVSNAKSDGIQGDLSVLVSGGSVTATATADTAKAIKSDVLVRVEGGAVVKATGVNDAINSNSKVQIAGGTLTLASSSKAIHADTLLEVSGGTVNVTKSYEALESGKTINISGGTIIAYSTDDGLNVAGGDGSAFMGPGGASTASASGSTFTMTGGFAAFYASGDGVDVNGAGYLKGGTLVVQGPANGGNSSVDMDSKLTITGGLLVGVGSSSMASECLPNTSSTQNAILTYFTSSVAANGHIRVQNAAGKSVLDFKPAVTAQILVFSSPDFVDGTYSVLTGGTYSGGTSQAGLLTGGTYSGGTAVFSGQSITGVQTLGSGGGSVGPRG